MTHNDSNEWGMSLALYLSLCTFCFKRMLTYTHSHSPTQTAINSSTVSPQTLSILTLTFIKLKSKPLICLSINLERVGKKTLQGLSDVANRVNATCHSRLTAHFRGDYHLQLFFFLPFVKRSFLSDIHFIIEISCPRVMIWLVGVRRDLPGLYWQTTCSTNFNIQTKWYIIQNVQHIYCIKHREKSLGGSRAQ